MLRPAVLYVLIAWALGCAVNHHTRKTRGRNAPVGNLLCFMLLWPAEAPLALLSAVVEERIDRRQRTAEALLREMQQRLREQA